MRSWTLAPAHVNSCIINAAYNILVTLHFLKKCSCLKKTAVGTFSRHHHTSQALPRLPLKRVRCWIVLGMNGHRSASIPVLAAPDNFMLSELIAGSDTTTHNLHADSCMRKPTHLRVQGASACARGLKLCVQIFGSILLLSLPTFEHALVLCHAMARI